MPISSITRKAGPFTGTGLVSVYPFSFKVFVAADLYLVSADTNGVETVLVLNTDYTVSLNADQNSNPGGSITLAAPLALNYTLVITSTVDNLQPTDLTNQGGFYPSVITDALDRACIQIQQLQEQSDRAPKVPLTSSVSTDQLATSVITCADHIAQIDTVAGNTANIDTVAGVSANVTTVAGISGNVTTVAGIAPNVTTVAGISANVTTVAGISGNVTTVAGISPDVTTVAGISADVTAVAAISADVQTAAANVADITNFADVYQGPKATDPTTRNDSSALQAGDLYFNTAQSKMRVYTGSAWIDAAVTFNPTTEFFSGTGAQTVYTLAASPGTANAVIIDIGGVKQKPGVDYTVAGTTLTFTTAPPLGTDNITVQSFGTAGIVNVPADASVTEAKLNLSDVTTGNVSITKHGFVPKAPNNTGLVLLGDGSFGRVPGSIVQVVEATPYTTRTQVSTVCPADDTIPQQSETTILCTATITPKSATNRLVIVGEIPGAFSGNITTTTAIFQDGTANALAARAMYTTGFISQLGISHEMAAGTTSATAIKLGLGVTSGSFDVNGNNINRLYGGVSAARLRVLEVQV